MLLEYYDDSVEFEEYFEYAVGELALACDEAKLEYPFLGQVLRATRRKLQEEEDYWPNFKSLFRWVRRLRLLVNEEEVDQEEFEGYIAESVAPIMEYLSEEEEEEKPKKVAKQVKGI